MGFTVDYVVPGVLFPLSLALVYYGHPLYAIYVVLVAVGIVLAEVLFTLRGQMSDGNV